MANWGKIAQAGGTVGRAYMRDRDRRRRERIEDYAFDQRQAQDQATADERERQERLQPLIAQYTSALQSGDEQKLDHTYNLLMSSPDIEPEQMAKFSELHQRTKQKIYDRNKGVATTRSTAQQNARGKGMRITDYDEYGNPTGYENIPEGELPAGQQADLEYKRSLARRYVKEGQKSSSASGQQSPGQQQPVSESNRIAVRRQGAQAWDRMDEREKRGKDRSSFIDAYEQDITGRKQQSQDDGITFTPYDSATQTPSQKPGGRIADVTVDVPSVKTESTNVTPAQSEVGIDGKLTKEEKDKLRAYAKAQSGGDPDLEERIYIEKAKKYIAQKGK